jgi:antitoxin component of MazEF toxin-antitoxin module
MQVEIVKWGNSSAVRLPAAAMKDLHIALGDRLELETIDGNIVLKPSPKTYSLRDMLAKINDQNKHALVDLGAAVGREVW